MIPVSRPAIGNEEKQAVLRVLSSSTLTQGPEVAAFEMEFSNIAVPGAECIAVNSGTSAQHLALLAAGIGPGDDVLVPSFTFAATANAVAMTGANPVFVDIDPTTYCMSVDAARSSLTKQTVAIMPVHLYGHPADLVALKALCDQHGLLLIEDAAQAHLAKASDKAVGTWGKAGTFSFYPTKNMTSGEGGMISTFDSELARRVRLLRNQGQEIRYQNELVGLNNRMSDLHAAIGRVQLAKLETWTTLRQGIASLYDQHLQGVETPHVAPDAVHVYHQYTIRVIGDDRESFATALGGYGIGTGVYYPTPVHRLKSYNRKIDLPETERAAREVLSLPIFPTLSSHEIERVIESVNAVAASGVGSG